MRHWTPRLVLYFLLPTLVTFPLLVGGGYLFARRALGTSPIRSRGCGVEEARAIGARSAADMASADMQRHCRDEVRGSVVRLTVISADGHVLCDTDADPPGW
jgi:hypothetical protein